MKFKMTKKEWLMFFAHVFLILAMVSLIFGSIGFQREGPSVSNVTHIDEVEAKIGDGDWETISLPYNFRAYQSGTPVVLRTNICPKKDDAVYIKMVRTPADVYFDDELVFVFGKMKNYPDFMTEPATELHMIETYGEEKEICLKLCFEIPTRGKEMKMFPMMLGSSKELLMERSRSEGLPFAFSVMLFIGGIALTLISAIILFADHKGILFLWLGLFSATAGMWSLGGTDFFSILFRESTFIYVVSFMGLFTFMVPLLRFTRFLIEYEEPKWLWFGEIFFAVSSGVALVLQLMGKISLSGSMFFFHYLIPAALVLLVIYTVREYQKYSNINAKRMILPLAALAISALMELVHYEGLFTNLFVSPFQTGCLFFLFYMGIVAGLTVKDSLHLRDLQKELDFEKDLMDIHFREQKNKSMLLAESESTLRRQRHDLRHQLAVLQDLANEDNEKLQSYLSELIDDIPKKNEEYCENSAVNAVVSHFAAICEKKQIKLSLNLAVPEDNKNVTDAELCAIFGNLMENGVEACERMQSGEKFIKLNSSLQFDILTITMDNSFNGVLDTRGNRFRSSKRDDFGIGLASITSVAQKSGGDASFESDGTVFLSSVYVIL